MRYFNHRSRSHLHRTGSLFFLLFCVASWAGAQTAQIPSAEVEKRVDMLLAKMMLDDKMLEKEPDWSQFLNLGYA